VEDTDTTEEELRGIFGNEVTGKYKWSAVECIVTQD